MSRSSPLPSKIEIFALWTGFACPPQVAGHLVLRRQENGGWTAIDEMTLEGFDLPEGRIIRFVHAIDDVATEPEPARFGRTVDELEWHFGSCTTDDSPALLVELNYESRQPLEMRTSSNHAHLLPWRFGDHNRVENFNPELSIAIAELLPDGWMFKERLRSSDRIFESEKEIRAEFAKRELDSVDRPDETYEQQMAKVNAAINKLNDELAHGEEVDLSRGNNDYTANQLRRLSPSELSKLVAVGFDLSTSDETGQTALMLAAFPPFSQDQFEKLVAAGAEVDARRADSMTGLMLACAGGMEVTVPFWLDAGAKADLRGPNGCTAMMLGAKHPSIVERLLQHGADVAAVDNDGDTALDYAIADQSYLGAGSLLRSIELLAGEIGRADVSLLKRSLDHAVEFARKTKVYRRVLTRLGMRPASENLMIARERAEQSEAPEAFGSDIEDFVDLEVNLADRIVRILSEAVAKAES